MATQGFKIRDLINAALRLIGIKSEGNDPTPYEMNSALYTLNEIINSWNVDGKMITTMSFNTFNINSSQQIYTFGPGGDFDVPTRPVYLEVATYKQLSSTPPSDLVMRIISGDEWATIVTKEITSSIPNTIYMDEAWPLANVYLWPFPSLDSTITLTYWQPLNDALTLDTELSMPPGYARALRYDLACNLAPEYGKSIPTDLLAVVTEVRAAMTIANTRPNRMVYPYEAQGATHGGGYEIYSDTFR